MAKVIKGKKFFPLRVVSSTFKNARSISIPPSKKFYLAVAVAGRDRELFFYSGSDISICPMSWAVSGEVEELKAPFRVGGYDSGSQQLITKRVKVRVDFIGVIKNLQFYLANVKTALVGNDILMNPVSNISLNTKSSIISVNRLRIVSSINASLAIKELERRRKKASNGQPNTNLQPDWSASSVVTVKVAPFSHERLVLNCQSVCSSSIQHVFLSDMDESNSVYVPSVMCELGTMTVASVVVNNTDSDVVIKKGQIMGRIMPCFDIDDNNFPQNLDKLTSCAIKLTLSDDDRVNLSSMVDNGKLTDEELVMMREKGVNVDLPVDVRVDDSNIPDGSDVNLEKEKSKAEHCKYWESKQEFVDKFQLFEMDEKLRERVGDLLWGWRHCFANPAHPEQMAEGVRVPPFRIKYDESMPHPKRTPPRRMNDKKRKALDDQMKLLLSQNVIEECTDSAGAIVSHANVIFEQRYLSSERRCVTKVRLVQDLRVTNLRILPVAHPLPLTDVFRSEAGNSKFVCYTNLDASSMYYQWRVHPDSYKKLFVFQAGHKLYTMKRLPMGMKTSGSLVQSAMEKLFSSVSSNVKIYLDDISVCSESVEAHLSVDLPKTLSICSRFNVLLKPAKADICQSQCRILGFSVSSGMQSLAPEKSEKIASIEFPRNKPEAVSRAAFFSYFLPLSPRLSELMVPLRRLAAPKKKFAPTPEDERQFEALKSHLLDPSVGVIRVCSPKIEDGILCFCDSSGVSVSSLLTQSLFPLPGSNLDPTKKFLYIIGCHSRLLNETETPFAIWLLELMALEEMCRKFRHILMNRTWYVCTDSMTVRTWCSLDRVPRDLARRIMRLQEFQFKILWIEGRCNPSDVLSRPTDHPTIKCSFPRLVENRIVNAKGEFVDHRKLFSEQKLRETEEYFRTTRRQPMADAVQPVEDVESMVDAEADDAARASILDAMLRPLERSTVDSNEAIGTSIQAVGCCSVTCQAIGLDDDAVDEGVVDERVDIPVENPVGFDSPPLQFDEFRLTRVRELQDNDSDIGEIKDYILNARQKPDKTEVLLCSKPVQHYFRNESSFRITGQGVLTRLWVLKNGTVSDLIVVGKDKFEELVKDSHFNPDSDQRHFGKRKTFNNLNKVYFGFSGREVVAAVVASCPSCRLYSHTRTNPEKEGNQISMAPNQDGSFDICGPLAGQFRSASGQPRYLFIYLDLHSRWTYAKVISNTSDREVSEALVGLRHRLCGMPRRVSCDNALLTTNSEALKMLKSWGCELRHGLQYVSRCQSKIERMVGSVMRLVCKISSAEPTLPFPRLVDDACLVINSSVSDGLPENKCPKDIHFANPPSNFNQLLPELVFDAKTSKMASSLTLEQDVKRFLRSRRLTSPRDYASRIRPGQLALQKKMIFGSCPRKLAPKVLLNAFKVDERVGTNAFRVKNLRDGSSSVLPGDLLVKVSVLDETGLLKLCDDMESLLKRENVARAAMRDAEAFESADAGVVSGSEIAPLPGRRLRSGRVVTASVLCSLSGLFGEE